MKKIIAIAAILAVTAAFSGCGSSSSSSSASETTKASSTVEASEASSESEATSEETTEAAAEATEAPTEATTEEAPADVTEAPAQPGQPSDNQDYIELARNAMNALKTAEMLGAVCMEYDPEHTLPSDERYALITNNSLNGYTFNATDDIKSFLAANFTDSAYDRFKYILDNDIYADGDDGLYATPVGRGLAYIWINNEPTIASSDEASFVFEAQYSLEGGEVAFSDFRVIKKDGVWVVSEISDRAPLT